MFIKYLEFNNVEIVGSLEVDCSAILRMEFFVRSYDKYVNTV